MSGKLSMVDVRELMARPGWQWSLGMRASGGARISLVEVIEGDQQTPDLPWWDRAYVCGIRDGDGRVRPEQVTLHTKCLPDLNDPLTALGLAEELDSGKEDADLVEELRAAADDLQDAGEVLERVGRVTARWRGLAPRHRGQVHRYADEIDEAIAGGEHQLKMERSPTTSDELATISGLQLLRRMWKRAVGTKGYNKAEWTILSTFIKER